MIIIRMSQIPKKIDNPTMMTKKKQKSIRKITRSTFSFLPPCDDKNEKKESIPKIEKNIVILHYGLQRRRRLFVISLIV